MGKPHVLEETISILRNIYLELDFDEVFNPLFITDDRSEEHTSELQSHC